MREATKVLWVTLMSETLGGLYKEKFLKSIPLYSHYFRSQTVLLELISNKIDPLPDLFLTQSLSYSQKP